MDAPFDLNDLYYFAALVDKRGFTAAAEATGIPKATLSRRLRALEQTLGVRLAHRTTRRFALTEAGEEFHTHCLRVLEEARAAREGVQARLAKPVGKVRMTCALGIVRMALADLLPAFLKDNPGVDVDLVAISRYVDLIEEGFDLALRSHTQPLVSSSLIARHVAESRMILVANPELFADGLPQSPAQLEGIWGLQLERREAAGVWRLRNGADEADVSFRPRIRCDDASLLLASATAGLGVASLPSPLCRNDLRSGRLVRILPDWSIPQGTLSLVFPSQGGMTRAVRALADCLAANLPLLLQ